MRSLPLHLAAAGVVLAIAAQGASAPEARQAAAPWRTVKSVSGDTSVVQTLLGNPAEAELLLQKSGQVGMESGPPEQLLTMVTTTTPLSNGGVIFFDGGVREIRWFDSTLKFVRTVAKQGTGPGEIPPMPALPVSPGIVNEDRTIWGLALDSRRRIVALHSTRAKGVLLYDARGVFERSWELPDLRATYQATLSPDDMLHVPLILPAPAGGCSGSAGEPVCQEVAIRFRLDGTVVDTIFAPAMQWNAPMFHSTINVGPARSQILERRFYRAPFIAYPMRAFTGHGHWMTARTGSYEIILHRLSGGPLLIRSNSPPVPVKPEERQLAFERLAQQLARGTDASSVSLRDIPAVKPRIRDIRSDPDGRIWVQLHAPAERVVVPPAPPRAPARGATAAPSIATPTVRYYEPAVFDVFAPTGDYLGRLRSPAGATVMGFAGKYLWTREVDSLDVQRLVRYTISARSAQSPAAEYWARR